MGRVNKCDRIECLLWQSSEGVECVINGGSDHKIQKTRNDVEAKQDKNHTRIEIFFLMPMRMGKTERSETNFYWLAGRHEKTGKSCYLGV